MSTPDAMWSRVPTYREQAAVSRTPPSREDDPVKFDDLLQQRQHAGAVIHSREETEKLFRDTIPEWE